MNVYNRWFQLVSCVIAMVMVANFQYAWTLFVTPMREANGWSLSAVQWAFTLFILFQTWATPAAGWLIDRLGPRLFFTLAGVMAGAGWTGLGYATSLPQLYVLYSLAGIGAAIVYGGSIGSALKWFRDRRGMAAGIMAAAFGGGAALTIPIIARILSSSGYREAFIWTGIIQGLIVVIVAQFMRHPKEEAVAAAAVSAAKPADRMGRHDFTTSEMLRVPTFYLMYFMFVLMATVGLVLTGQAGPVARSWGISLAALTWTTTLGPIAGSVTRIVFGSLSDRIGREPAMALGFLLCAANLVLALTLGPTSDLWFTVTFVGIFFTWGEMYSLFPAALADRFGTRYATGNYAVLYTGKGVGSILGGGFAAMTFERTGSWTLAFVTCAVMALVAGLLAFGLRAWTAAPKTVAVPSPAHAK